jgi:hypothetical protein
MPSLESKVISFALMRAAAKEGLNSVIAKIKENKYSYEEFVSAGCSNAVVDNPCIFHWCEGINRNTDPSAFAFFDSLCIQNLGHDAQRENFVIERDSILVTNKKGWQWMPDGNFRNLASDIVYQVFIKNYDDEQRDTKCKDSLIVMLQIISIHIQKIREQSVLCG